MNFVDTAITLLHVTGKTMAVEDLCQIAVDRDMLDKPGANPLRSMKTRMTVELKKGRKSRLLKDGDEGWRLRAGTKLPDDSEEVVKGLTKGKNKLKLKKAKVVEEEKPAAKAKAKRNAKPAATKDSKTAKEKTETLETKAKKAPAKTKAKPPAKSKKKAVEEPAVAPEDLSAAVEEKAPARKKRRRTRKGARREEQVTEETAASTEVEEQGVAEEEVTPVELTAEEKALVEVYGKVDGTMSAAELNEYRDHMTKDEDRPMLPEIKAERRPHRRRERTRKRRVRGDRPERAERNDRPERSERTPRPRRGEQRDTSATSRPRALPGARDIAGAPIAPVAALPMVGEGLVRNALAVLRTLPNGQSMPVRQLTQTMIRQKLLDGTADQQWRMVKGLLLVSEQRRTTRGLSVLVRYHGKDLFSANFPSNRSAVDLASLALQQAAESFVAAVETETLERLSALALPMLERIAHIYLQTTGWTDIQWVRRIEGSAYAIATAPGAVDQTLIGVRCGPDAIDRRGVGELQAGVYAKDLSSGFLLSPCALSEEADQELSKEGTSIRVLCGRDFIADLIAREVGVTWQHVQLPQIDQRFYDAVLS